MSDWRVASPSVLAHALGPAIMERFLRWNGPCSPPLFSASAVSPSLEEVVREKGAFGFFVSCRRRWAQSFAANVGKWNIGGPDGKVPTSPATEVWVREIQQSFALASKQAGWDWLDADMRIELTLLHDLRWFSPGSEAVEDLGTEFDPVCWGALYEDGTHRSSFLPARTTHIPEPHDLTRKVPWSTLAGMLREQAGVPREQAGVPGGGELRCRYAVFRVREFRASLFDTVRHVWRLKVGPLLRSRFVEFVLGNWQSALPPNAIWTGGRMWRLTKPKFMPAAPAMGDSLAPWEHAPPPRLPSPAIDTAHLGGDDVVLPAEDRPAPPSTLQYVPAELVRNAEVLSLLARMARAGQADEAVGEFVRTFLPPELVAQRRGMQASEAAALLLEWGERGFSEWAEPATGCVRAILLGASPHPLTALRMVEGLLRRSACRGGEAWSTTDPLPTVPAGLDVLHDRPHAGTDVYRLQRMTRVAAVSGAEGLVWVDLRRAWEKWGHSYRTLMSSLATSFLLAAFDGLSHLPRSALTPPLRSTWLAILRELCVRWLPDRPGFPLDARGDNTARVDHAGVLAATTLL